MIRFWVSEFDIDGIRLDAADVLDFDFMKALRQTANEVKADFWLMGEVIHGDYGRWVGGDMLHSVTNYQLHKALFSGHNDHNYFEIAHTVNYLHQMLSNHSESLKLYNFVDNHDVERIYTKLNVKEHFTPVHILLYTLPGIPSLYYGSEFGIEGRKENGSDDSLRPHLTLSDFDENADAQKRVELISKLSKVRQETKALSYGSYQELLLTNRQYAFSRTMDDTSVIITVNNDENEASLSVRNASAASYTGALSGKTVTPENGMLNITLPACSGEIWIPEK